MSSAGNSPVLAPRGLSSHHVTRLGISSPVSRQRSSSARRARTDSPGRVTRQIEDDDVEQQKETAEQQPLQNQQVQELKRSPNAARHGRTHSHHPIFIQASGLPPPPLDERGLPLSARSPADSPGVPPHTSTPDGTRRQHPLVERVASPLQRGRRRPSMQNIDTTSDPTRERDPSPGLGPGPVPPGNRSPLMGSRSGRQSPAGSPSAARRHLHQRSRSVNQVGELSGTNSLRRQGSQRGSPAPSSRRGIGGPALMDAEEAVAAGVADWDYSQYERDAEYSFGSRVVNNMHAVTGTTDLEYHQGLSTEYHELLRANPYYWADCEFAHLHTQHVWSHYCAHLRGKFIGKEPRDQLMDSQSLIRLSNDVVERTVERLRDHIIATNPKFNDKQVDRAMDKELPHTHIARGMMRPKGAPKQVSMKELKVHVHNMLRRDLDMNNDHKVSKTEFMARWSGIVKKLMTFETDNHSLCNIL